MMTPDYEWQELVDTAVPLQITVTTTRLPSIRVKSPLPSRTFPCRPFCRLDNCEL
jgi:hypothetical protein